MSKIYYIANNRFPTERAHGIQIAETCRAIKKEGQDILLLVPNRFNAIKVDYINYYSLDQSFEVKKLFTIDFLNKLPNKLTFFLQSITFALSILFFIKKNYKKGDAIYSRDQFSLFILSFFIKNKIFYEMHNFPKKINFFHKILFKKIKFIVISNGLRDELLKINIKKEDTLIAPDGINLNQMVKFLKPKDEIRKKFKLPIDKKIVLYTGQLYDWKGVNTLLVAAKFLPQYLFIFIGGNEKDVSVLKKEYQEYNNIIFLGHINHQDVLEILPSADVLVLPNSNKVKISSQYTSPMKLFEYMASHVPIVVSNLPSMREIVDESMVVFFEADNYESLIDSILKIFNSQENISKLSVNSFKRVAEFDWQIRAKKIIDFIKYV